MKKIFLASLLMTSSIFFSRIIGYLRDAIIAAKFGAGVETDAYFAAFTLPDFLNYLVAGGAFSITFIPIFTSFMVKGDEDRGWKIYSIIISIMTLVLIVAVIILQFLMPQIIQSMFPGFTQEALDRTILFTRIVLPAQLFFYNGGIIAAILMSKKRFAAPALAPLIYNISIIIFGLIFSKWGMIGFAIGALIGSFIGPFFIPFILIRKEIKFKLNFNIKDRDFINFIKLSLPIMAGLILVTLDDWLSKRYGSFLEKGTLSWLNNSRRLILLPIGLFAQANAQAVLPFLSEYFAKNEFDKFKNLAIKTLSLVFYLTTFTASWYILFSKEIIIAVYKRGAYTIVDAQNTSIIFLFFSFAVPFWGGVIIISRVYYAMGKTLPPMFIGGLMTLISLPIFPLLSDRFGAYGLTITISIVKVLYFLTLLIFLLKSSKIVSLWELVGDLVKILPLFTIITTIFYYVKQSLPNINSYITLFIGSAIFISITLFLSSKFRIESYNEFYNRYLMRVLRKIFRIKQKTIKS
ncbi:murein biosynthesis integral membrane protein MurJ [bacterium]|nr:murein biosynthesis integral membrane protein MurJ [bacterium]